MPKINTDKNKIKQLLERGVENIYPNPKFLHDKLLSGKQLKIYLGIDPTGPSLHLGHVVPVMKLREFQELGHKTILLIGSFTAMIGDPDKETARKQLSREQVMSNCKNYQKQLSAILEFKGKNKTELKYNDKWLDKLSFKEIVGLAANFTVQQMLERDMFEKRIKKGKPIGLHEFLYPLMQSYDCVAMGVDGEIGGNDQTFNMLAGRTLMKAMQNKEKFVLSAKLLVDPAGKKMGKTEGNMASLDSTAEDMYGKVMSWPDELIIPGLEICTRLPMSEVKQYKKQLKEEKVNPRDIKMKLSFEVVKIYHGLEKARRAENYFVKTIQKKEAPDEVKTIKISVSDKINIIDLLTETRLATSKSEARRLVEQRGVKINNKIIERIEEDVRLDNEGILIQKGKRHFIKAVKK